MEPMKAYTRKFSKPGTMARVDAKPFLHQLVREPLLQAINDVLDCSLNIETAHLDFEAASANSLKSMFPNIKIKRCWFHCLQCWRRKLIKESLHEYTRGPV